MLDSVAEFFAMGGYARFVWSAYAVTFFVLFVNLLVSRIEHRRLVNRLSLERQLDSGSSKSTTVNMTTNSETSGHTALTSAGEERS